MTDLVKLKLIRRRDWDSSSEAQAMQRLMTVLVEVKTSRSDFVGDHKWKADIPVDLAYIAIPSTLPVRPEEFPAGWGVLHYYETTKLIRCVRVPSVIKVSTEQQLSVVLNISLRRDNNTRYERLNQLRKQIRQTENTDISRIRTRDAMSAVLSIVQGKYGSVENALGFHGVKNLWPCQIESLQKLWAIAPEIAKDNDVREALTV
jgi:hypothetical protein